MSAAESRFLRAFGLVDTGGVVSSRHRIGTTRQQPAAVGCHASSRTLLPFVVHDDAFCKFAKCSPSRRVLRLESYYIAPTPPLSRSIKVTESRKRLPNPTSINLTMLSFLNILRIHMNNLITLKLATILDAL